MLHHLYSSVQKHAEELGGSATGVGVYIFKYFLFGERIWQDLHDLLMAGLSAVVGYLAVMLVRKVIATASPQPLSEGEGLKNKEDAKA